MSRPRLAIPVLGALALASTLLGGSAAYAAPDTAPPSPPLFGYAQGFSCRTLIIGVVKSTDNVTPQDHIRYEVFDEGVFLGPLTDRGNGPWGVLQLTHAGTNTVTVQAVDSAGNRSTSRPVTVTGYYTPGCVPWSF